MEFIVYYHFKLNFRNLSCSIFLTSPALAWRHRAARTNQTWVTEIYLHTSEILYKSITARGGSLASLSFSSVISQDDRPVFLMLTAVQ